MRRIRVSATTIDGEVLDIQEGEVRDGVSQLSVFEVLPGTDIIEHQVVGLTIGTGGTTWQSRHPS